MEAASNNKYPLTAYVLSLGGRCNNHCGICLCKDTRGPAVSNDEILRRAAAMSPHFDGFILTGGEPALLDSPEKLLTELGALCPSVLQVHTNGRMFAYKDYTSRFSNTAGVDFIVRIYSHKPEVHDAITGVQGSCVQTLKGIRNLAETVAGRCGVYVELPIMSDNAADGPELAGVLGQLRVDGILLTGGYPAMGVKNLDSAVASHLIAECRKRAGEIPCRSQYATETEFIGGAPAQFRSPASGKWIVGADTNNPFVFRGCVDTARRALLISPPNTPGMNVRLFVSAPASLAALNGFLELLGYGCDLADLETHPLVNSGALDELCNPDEILKAGCVPPTDGRLIEAAGKMIEPLLEKEYAVTGISTPDFIQAHIGAHIAAFIRARQPGAVIAAGPLRSEERAMFQGGADYVCETRIFGEYYLSGLMNRLEFGDRCGVAIYGNNLSRISNKGFFLNMMCDMEKLPCPAYGGLDASGYLREISTGLSTYLRQRKIEFDPAAKIGFATYYASRGCRHKCSCCGNQHALAQRNPVQAARHMADIAEQTGLRCFFMLDTAINNREDFLADFCAEMIRLGSPALWMVSARPDFRNAEVLCMMRSAGCVMLTLGVETGSDHVLKKLRKGFSVDAAEKSLEWITSAGIMASVNLMSGYVDERWEDVEATVSFIRRNRERIDFIGDHTSFVWYDGIRVTEDQARVRFRPGFWHTPQGRSRVYDAEDGRKWEEILEFKKRAFSEIETCLAGFHKYAHTVREYDIFHIFSLGHDRRLAREYMDYAAAQGGGEANYIFRDWMKYFVSGGEPAE